MESTSAEHNAIQRRAGEASAAHREGSPSAADAGLLKSLDALQVSPRGSSRQAHKALGLADLRGLHRPASSEAVLLRYAIGNRQRAQERAASSHKSLDKNELLAPSNDYNLAELSTSMSPSGCHTPSTDGYLSAGTVNSDECTVVFSDSVSELLSLCHAGEDCSPQRPRPGQRLAGDVSASTRTAAQRVRRKQRAHHQGQSVDFDTALEQFYEVLPKANSLKFKGPRAGSFGASPRSQDSSPRRSGLRAGPGLREFVLGVSYTDVHRSFVLEEKEMASGQFGSVRKCTEIATGREFACKSISKRMIKRAEDVADIRREVASLELLKGHEGVVRVEGVFEDRQSVHIVMELCKGGDLLDYILAHGPLSEPEAAELCRTLVHTLTSCHSYGLIHRDVKPENIMLTESSGGLEMKLADFGLAVFSSKDAIRQDAKGTLEYLAPEVFRQAYNHQADIWSAGVTLYVALSGIPPFWASQQQSLKESILNQEVRFPQQKWGTKSKDCMDLVRRMLDKDPCTRITAAEVLNHPWIQK